MKHDPFSRPKPVSGAALRDDQILVIAKLAMAEAGFRLDTSKREFLQMRLNRRVQATGTGDYAAYLTLLQRDRNERKAFVEALTVHTTSFFREDHQYKWLREQGMPTLIKDHSRLVFWSAAASSGQEGWSSLITAAEYRKTTGPTFNFELIGTDVSEAILAKAAEAVYFADEVNTVPPEVRSQYFLRSRQKDGRFRVIPELRAHAKWHQGNLVSGAGLPGISCHVAFLRNVLIYFDKPTQAVVIDRVVRNIKPGGYLLTGHSETGFSHPDLVPLQPSIFKKEGHA